MRLEQALPLALIREERGGPGGPATATRRSNHQASLAQQPRQVRGWPIPPRHRTALSAPSHLWYAPQGHRQAPPGTLCTNGYRLGRGGARPDHGPGCLSMPPKYRVAQAVGRLQGQAALRSHRAPGADTPLHRAAWLGAGRRCEYRRLGRGRHAALHPPSGGARETRRAPGVGGLRAAEVRHVHARGGSRPSRSPLRGPPCNSASERAPVTAPSPEGFLQPCPLRGPTITAPLQGHPQTTALRV